MGGDQVISPRGVGSYIERNVPRAMRAEYTITTARFMVALTLRVVTAAVVPIGGRGPNRPYKPVNKPLITCSLRTS